MTDAFRGGCSPRLDRCKVDCGHRRVIEDYRIERHRQEMVEEEETLGYVTELRLRRESGQRPITFKEWIIGHREVEPERDASEDLDDVAGALSALGW